ncbi:choice-of-anchor Q domain-containing protein, partial [Candidatus Sumerlaeota bacterium]
MATRGGGLDYCRATIQNNTIWANEAGTEGHQLARCSTPTFSCIQDWTGGGEGNISADPLFVDAANGDFHLLAGSPCIDSGMFIEGLTADIEGNMRPFDGSDEARGDGSDFDMGAFEYVEPGTVMNVWHFADGDTRDEEQTYVLVLNPDADTTATMRFEVFFEDREPLSIYRSVAPNSRY